MNRLLVFALLLLLLAPRAASSAACTRGVDCYSDCVTNTAGTGADVGIYAGTACQTKGIPKWSSVVMVEDGENPAYMTSAADGSGTWADICSGIPGTRGCGSAYRSYYHGAIQAGCSWEPGQPASPTRGTTFTTESNGRGACEWSPSDTWNGNSCACIDVHQSGDTRPAGVNAPAVYGNAVFGELRGTGTTWDSPAARLWSDKTTVAYSAIISFSSSYYSQKTAQIKFPEWVVTEDNSRNHLHMMGSGPDWSFPYGNLLLWPGYISNAECQTLMAGAVVHVGNAAYDHVSGYIQPGTKSVVDLCLRVGGGGNGWISVLPEGYDRATDWPDMTVPHASKMLLSGLGSSNTTWKVWFDDRLILWIDGMNTSLFSSAAKTIRGLDWDHYWNQVADGTPLGTAAVRWNDNVMIRGWSDSECTSAGADCGAMPTLAQMEFGASGPTLGLDSITPSPSSGTAPLNDVDFTFSLSGSATGDAVLAADCDNDGSYEASVTDTAAPWLLADACDFATSGTKTVPVRVTRQGVQAYNSATVTVNPAAAPTITLSTSALTVSAKTGFDTASQTFTVRNSGSGTLSYAVTDDAAWLSVGPDGTSTGEADTLTATFNTTGLAEGSYSATVTVTDPMATPTTATATVNLTVSTPTRCCGALAN